MGILSLIPGLASVAEDVLDRVIPDPVAAAAAKEKLLELQQSGELAQLNSVTSLATAQIGVDNTEAASTDPLQHWRGAAGWVCVLGLGYQFLLSPIGTWVSQLAGYPIVAPTIDGTSLQTLLWGMLGLGTMHVAPAVIAATKK